MLTVSLLVCAMMALAAANDEVTVIPTAPVCHENFTQSNGRCYQFMTEEMTWTDAEVNCQSLGANLASVHSLPEDQFIYALIKITAPHNPETWIGGSDCQENNVWLWSNGKDFTHTNWDTSFFPEDKHGCILVNHGAKIRWTNDECSKINPSVCAYDL